MAEVRSRFWMMVLLMGCGGDRSEPAVQAADTASAKAVTGAGYYRGIAARSGNAVMIALCGAPDTLRLLDPRNLLSPTDSATFVVVAGQRTTDEVTVERALYAAAGRFECFADWSGFVYRATGVNPGWVAEVSKTGVALRREGGRSWQWTAVTKDSTPDRIHLTAPAAAGQPPLNLTLQLRECRSAAGARSAWTAQLVHGTDRLTGCAVPGVR